MRDHREVFTSSVIRFKKNALKNEHNCTYREATYLKFTTLSISSGLVKVGVQRVVVTFMHSSFKINRKIINYENNVDDKSNNNK